MPLVLGGPYKGGFIGNAALGLTASGALQDSVGPPVDPDPIEDYSDLSGSVQNFGAVGDGVADDTLAIQAAFNSGELVYFPPGEYVLSAPIQITRPVIVRCFGTITNAIYPSTQALRTNFRLDGLSPSSPFMHPKILGENVRFLLSSNHNAFEIKTSYIDWVGGVVDFVEVSGAIDKAGFAVFAQSGGVSGRIDAITLGPPDISAGNQPAGIWNGGPTDGPRHARLIFTGQPSDASIHNLEVIGEDVRGCHSFCEVDPKTDSQECFFNDYRTSLDDCHNSNEDYGSDKSLFYANVQGGSVWTTEAQAGTYPSTLVHGEDNVIQYVQYSDFETDSGSAGGTRWKQETSTDFTVNPVIMPLFIPFNRLNQILRAVGRPKTIEIIEHSVEHWQSFSTKHKWEQGGEVRNANLANASDDVNQFAKIAGSAIVSAQDRILRVAEGPNPTDTWLAADGNSARDITPT